MTIIPHPCVVLPLKVAAGLYVKCDLDRLLVVHRSELDDEEHKALTDMKLAAEWYLQRGSGTSEPGFSTGAVPSTQRGWKPHHCTPSCLTTGAVAKRLGITDRAVRKRIKSGKYKAHRASGSWHIQAEEIKP